MATDGQNKDEDIELMLKARGGDVQAFEAIVERHHRALINFFYRLVYDHQLAEDYAQEVFVKLYTHADDYHEMARFTTYLYRIARNLWVDEFRKRKARPKLKPQSSFEDGILPENPGISDKETPSGSADALLEKERGQIVHEALDKLSETDRVILNLSMIKGLKYSEIAKILEIPEGTVKSRVHNAMKHLRDELKDKGIWE